MANFKKYTRYTNGQTAKNRSGQDFLILRPSLNLAQSSGDTTVTITRDLLGRPDLISYKAYGTSELWWAIFEYNGIKDPLFDLQVNQIIKIPNLNRVIKAIQNLGKT